MKTIILAMLGIGLLVFSGCVAPKSEFVPPGGALFTSYKAPLLISYDDAAVSQHSGEASASYFHDWVLTGLDLAWNDCSLNTAVQDGRFTRVGSADYSFFSILGIYAQTTVHVYEAPSVAVNSGAKPVTAVPTAGNMLLKEQPGTPLLKNNPVKAQPTVASPKAADTATQLKKLQELKDAGLLTEEEYQTKRKALVGQL
ncbi:MAG: TRL domain-containing protein [Kiritimatiellales bacterium]